MRLSSNFDCAFNFIAGLYYNTDDTGIYDLSDAWTLYGGACWTDDEGRATDFRVVPIIPVQPTQGYDDPTPTGRVGLRHRLSEDAMVYVQYARGVAKTARNSRLPVTTIDRGRNAPMLAAIARVALPFCSAEVLT